MFFLFGNFRLLARKFVFVGSDFRAKIGDFVLRAFDLRAQRFVFFADLRVFFFQTVSFGDQIGRGERAFRLRQCVFCFLVFKIRLRFFQRRFFFAQRRRFFVEFGKFFV